MDNELSKGFTGIEINGVRFSSLVEMLRYMDKQRDHIIKLEQENAELKNEWQEQVQKAIDEGYARTQLQIENGNLKEQIEELQEENIQLLKEWRTMDKAKQKVELKVAELMGDKSTLEQDCKRFQAQIEKMKCCGNCNNWNWKHSKCEKKLKGDCFKASKWVMRNF